MRPRTVIPVHYEGWSHFQESRETVERELARLLGDARWVVRWLALGVAVELTT